MVQEIYTKGEYLKNNPTWHFEDSAWKAKQILRMIAKNDLHPKTICEVGCGAGEILSQLQQNMDKDIEFRGFEVSPQAMELCRTRANQKLRFELKDIMEDRELSVDLLLAIDLIEHLEDYLRFLKNIRPKAGYKIFHVPLELSVQTVLRVKPILASRKDYGHIHYFTKETALQALKDAGYELVDFFYTAWSTELPAKTVKTWIIRLPRKILFSINQDLAARILGGYSLLVLAK